MEKFTVSYSELAEITQHLLRRLEQDGVGQIELSVDYYWDISKEELYQPYDAPEKLTIGQVSDDLNELRRVMRGERAVIPYHLVWLASVLRAVGYTA